jgi:hypothetical protein
MRQTLSGHQSPLPNRRVEFAIVKQISITEDECLAMIGVLGCVKDDRHRVDCVHHAGTANV